MRSSLILAFATFALLAACQMTGPGGDGGQGLATEEIAVTSLDAPAEAEPTAPDATLPRPETRPEPRPDLSTEGQPEGSAPDAEAPGISLAPDVPEVPKTPQQILCEKGGGLWTVAGETGAFLCVAPTRDGGKACHRKSDCQGECLARSGTCSPYDPLFGCNEVLDKDGRRMTLCLD